jgi:hypothetical protein
MVDIGKQMLSQYKPREVSIDCFRCRRHAHCVTAVLLKKFGDQRLGVAARMLARSVAGIYGPCGLAEDPFTTHCSARAVEADPITWARIDDAEKGGWRAYLHCHRRLENLKRAKSCSEVIELPVLVLKAHLGWDFPLEAVPRKYRCPHCGSKSTEIEWVIPAEAPDPSSVGAAPDDGPILQLRPQGAERGRRVFRVIENRPARKRSASHAGVTGRGPKSRRGHQEGDGQ